MNNNIQNIAFNSGNIGRTDKYFTNQATGTSAVLKLLYIHIFLTVQLVPSDVPWQTK